MTAPRRGERGAASVELAILVPAAVLLLALLVATGRVWFARTTVVDSAQAAARAASLARTSEDARGDAATEARRALATGGLACTDTAVSVDLAAFGAAAGTAATVRSTISCRLSFGDLLLPGMPGSMTLTGRGASALDTYRARR